MKISSCVRCISQIISTRFRGGRKIEDLLSLDIVLDVIDNAYTLFSKEPFLIDIPASVRVVGDLHGNIDDLLRILEDGGYPPKQKYLFLGDYADRGKYGLEVVIFLFSLKVLFPDMVFLIRGNHEIQNVSETYGFLSECQQKYSSLVFFQIHSVFRKLPLVAIVEERIICVHGGIGPQMMGINEMRKLDKPEVLLDPSICADLMWSDPRDCNKEFAPNGRGSGYYFNSVALENFLKANDLDLLIRSHELCEGYFFPFEKTEKCITVFSSSNYCGRNNHASAINISKDINVTVTNFNAFSISEKSEWIPEVPAFIIDFINAEKEILAEPNSEIEIFQKSIHGLSHSAVQSMIEELKKS